MRRTSLSVATAGCAGALLLAGCGSSAPKQPPTATLSRAAYVSSAAPGYKMTMSLRETVPNAGQVTVTGNGGFNIVPKREGFMTMHLVLPAAATAGLGNLQMQAVFVPGTIYIKLPPQLATRLPGGKPWLLINLNQLGKAAGIPGLGQLTSTSSSLSNPGQYLQFLRATTTGMVKDLGQATVDGVKTTHYRAVVDLAGPADGRAAARHGAQESRHDAVADRLLDRLGQPDPPPRDELHPADQRPAGQCRPTGELRRVRPAARAGGAAREPDPERAGADRRPPLAAPHPPAAA
jgi:hypothetical protein